MNASKEKDMNKNWHNERHLMFKYFRLGCALSFISMTFCMEQQSTKQELPTQDVQICNDSGDKVANMYKKFELLKAQHESHLIQNDPKQELSAQEIVQLCTVSGNFELAEIYKHYRPGQYKRNRFNEYAAKLQFYNESVPWSFLFQELERLDSSSVEECFTRVYTMYNQSQTAPTNKKRPAVMFKKDDPFDICPVCWSSCKGNPTDDSITLFCCDHKFHIGCLVAWMEVVNKSCPTCKKNIAETLEWSCQNRLPLLYIQAYLSK